MRKLSSRYPMVIKWIGGIVAVLLLLPELLRFGIVYTVSSQGLGKVEVRDIDLNLLTGTLSVKQFDLMREKISVLSVGELNINLSWHRLLFGEVGIETFSIEQVQLSAVQRDDGIWEIVIPLPNVSSNSENSTAANNEKKLLSLPKLAIQQLLIQDVNLSVESNIVQGQLNIERLFIRQISSWQQWSPSLVMSATWNKAPIELKINAEPLALEPSFQGTLVVNSFPLESFRIPSTQLLTAALTLNISFEGVHNQQGISDIAINGDILLDKLAMTYDSLTINHQQLLWQAKAKALHSEQQLTYQVEGNIQSSGLSIVDHSNELALLNWDKLSVSNLSIDQQLNVSTDQLTIQSIDLLKIMPAEQPKELQSNLYTGLISTNDLQLKHGKKLMIDTIDIVDAQYQVVVETNGKLTFLTALNTLLSEIGNKKSPEFEQTRSETTADDYSTPSNVLLVAVNSISVTGDSYLALQDLRFVNPVANKITIDQFSVKNIDQSQVEQPAIIDFSSRVGEFSSAQFSGEVKPFSQQVSAAISGQLNAIALPQLSPYGEAYLGYHLTTGQYDHNFDLSIDKGELALQNTLTLRQLTLSAVDSEKPSSLGKQLDIPLAFALNMLRDSDDNITLDVPIRGKLNDPAVNVSAVVSDALGIALKKGASHYLKYAIQPYGAVIMAAQFVGERANSVVLDPILQNVGQLDLSDQHLLYIDKVATLMQQRPALTITLCGRVNDKDKQAMIKTPALLENSSQEPSLEMIEKQTLVLAEQRAVQIKRLLVNQSIDSSRIFLCQPQFQEQGISGVSMAM